MIYKNDLDFLEELIILGGGGWTKQRKKEKKLGEIRIYVTWVELSSCDTTKVVKIICERATMTNILVPSGESKSLAQFKQDNCINVSTISWIPPTL